MPYYQFLKFFTFFDYISVASRVFGDPRVKNIGAMVEISWTSMLMIRVEVRSIHRGLYMGSSLVLSVPLFNEKPSKFNSIVFGILVGLHMWLVYLFQCRI